MRDESIALPSLAVVIVVVLLCCTLATVISVCFVRSRLPRRYLYCSSCSTHVGLLPLYGECQVEVRPRPWVEVLGHNVPHNSNHLPILQESGTFQRLGMKSVHGTTEPDLAVLEVDQLQTRPMTNPRPLELGDPAALRNKIISPTSAEVFARRDTARSKLSRMSSRRTLQFKSPVEPVVSPGPEQGRLTVPRQVRRSLSERRERSSRKQEEDGVTSQEEDERGSGASSAQTVIRVNRQARKQPASITIQTDKLHNKTGAARRPTNFDNPAYESASVDDRSTAFLSGPAPPPRIIVTDTVLSPERKSVITKGRIRL